MLPIYFQTTDWTTVPVTEHRGESGMAYWRTKQFDAFRMRLVEYSAGYKANHWCAVGHVLFCLEGEMTCELSDGRTFLLKKGMSYEVSDNVSLHRSHTSTGVKLLIIDGAFLKQQHRHRNPWRI